MKSFILIIFFFAFSNLFSNNLFIKNIGQYDSNILYYSQLNDINIFIKIDGIYFDFYQLESKSDSYLKKGHLVKMDFIDGKSFQQFNEEKIGEVNYFLGNDKSKWKTNVPFFNELTINNVYDKIDFRIYFEDNVPRYDFIVNVDGNPNEIKLKFQTIENIELTSKKFKAIMSVGDFINDGLFAYQNNNGNKNEVSCNFILKDENILAFEIKDYDKTKPLIIDPIIYTSYVSWGGNEKAATIKNLSATRYLIAGTTESLTFPVSEGAYQEFVTPSKNVFIAEYQRDLINHNLIRGTFLGGDGDDIIIKLITDLNGDIFVCGNTKSFTFPTVGTLRDFNAGKQDGFVSCLSSDLTQLKYSYYIGGSEDDYMTDIKVSNGRVYFSGYTFSENLPIKGALQNNLLGSSDGMIGRSNQAGSSLDFLTYWGGSGEDRINALDLNSVEDILWVGSTNSQDFPILPINETSGKKGIGFDIVTGTFRNGLTENINSFHLGGTSDDFGVDIIHSSGNEYYVLGYSQKEQTNTIPTNQESFSAINSGGFDILFLKMLSTNVSKATFIGGRNDDIPTNFKRFLPNGDFVIVGETSSSDFPIVSSEIEPITYGRNKDGFVTIVSRELEKLNYSSYIGGREDDVLTGCDILNNTNFSFVGYTNSNDLKLFGKSNLKSIQSNGAFVGFHNNGSISLQNPAGGNSYCMGVILPIMFTFNDLDNNDLFDIYLSNPSLEIFQLLVENHNNTSYNWDIPINLIPHNDYKIIVAHKSGVFDESTLNFTINPIPVINEFNLIEGSPETCVGETIAFSVNTSNTVTPEFVWRRNGTQLVKNKNNIYRIEEINTSNSGKYTVTIEDRCQPYPTSDEIEIKVIPNTNITNQSADFEIFIGDRLVLNIAAEGAELTYQWYFEDNLLAGKTENELIIENASISDQGSYKCEVIGKCGEKVISEPIEVLVNTKNVLNSKFKNLYSDKNQIKFDYSSKSVGEIQLRVLNYMGQIVFESNLNVTLGLNEINQNVSLQNGVYFINIIELDNASTFKFIILE